MWVGGSKKTLKKGGKMAKCTINYICGHSEEIQLYGPNRERERKAAWMEGNDCKVCWLVKKREKENLMPIIAKIECNGLDRSSDDRALIQISLSGGCYPKKEDIKEMGYEWTENRMGGGIMGMLSMRMPAKCWMKIIPIGAELEAAINQISAYILPLGGSIQSSIGHLDIAMMQLGEAKAEARKVG